MQKEKSKGNETKSGREVGKEKPGKLGKDLEIELKYVRRHKPGFGPGNSLSVCVCSFAVWEYIVNARALSI